MYSKTVFSFRLPVQWTTFKAKYFLGVKNHFSVPSFSQRNLFILNKFLITGKISITCRELYFEEVGHVYLITMVYFPENEIFTVKDHVQNDTYSY